ECVLKAALTNYNTDLPEEVICIASGFGGGIGRSRHLCGAISGAVMALGMFKGRRDPLAEDSKTVTEIYPDFKEIITEIEECFGTTICGEMLAKYKDGTNNPMINNCDDVIKYCAKTLVKYIERED
ncbi:MAG: C-GCAxxG-C-C family protein, partial [Anaerovoracaceae bacterium]